MVNSVQACHKQGRAKVADGLSWVLGDVIGEDGLHTIGNVDKGELLNWSLQVGIRGKLVTMWWGKELRTIDIRSVVEMGGSQSSSRPFMVKHFLG